MHTKQNIRVRFAPSPTGMIHLGNVRTALMNYLFAKKNHGSFILRIEDTDQSRLFDKDGAIIIENLLWLGLEYNEGPLRGGPYSPYIQSLRHEIYQENLQTLVTKKLAYRCFCSTQELEVKRERQIALKLPPRYDQHCTKLTEQHINDLLAASQPFIWRMKLNSQEQITIHDLAHGTMNFDLRNFSDFALTRQDGSVTFLFANFVDDMTMKMSHVIRGEDHLSNTANQAALYNAFDAPLPIFWHLQIICNAQGKKLSKRDFGFALHDLQSAGYLPQAIVNYLAIIGGGKFDSEIMSLDELVHAISFDSMSSTGHVRYDCEKLNWINHKWISRIEHSTLVELCLNYLIPECPQAATMDKTILSSLVQLVKSELVTLKDVCALLAFYFIRPTDTLIEFLDPQSVKILQTILPTALGLLATPAQFVEQVKSDTKKNNISLKTSFTFLRIGLTGKPNGLSLLDLITALGAQESADRIKKIL